ncbi:MAG TPA: hypothetical protein VGP18_08510 [Solirubrobacteraceae bacterium]|jgi:hypothetical protein|nr:hypothetical protein [Solirubrobacteraceae bacterium]
MANRDAERLEEEITGIERPERHAGLSGEYLLQALDGLHDAGDPAHLFAHWRRFPPDDPGKVENEMRAAALRARVRAARTAVLFAALAAESYVNEFLSVHGTLEKWDREPTHRKFLKGTHEAYGSQLFFVDREGYQPIVDLFKLRNRLVHPKPGFGVSGLHGDPETEFEQLFAMPKVAEYIVAVGGSADLLMPRAYGFESVDIAGMVIWRGKSVIRDYAQRHAKLPAWDAPAERPLFRQAGDHVMAIPALPNVPGTSWTRLREARQKREASSAATSSVSTGEQ